MKQAQLVLVLLAGAAGTHAGVVTAVGAAKDAVNVKCLPDGEGQIDVRNVACFDDEVAARAASEESQAPVAEGETATTPLNVCWPA